MQSLAIRKVLRKIFRYLKADLAHEFFPLLIHPNNSSAYHPFILMAALTNIQSRTETAGWTGASMPQQQCFTSGWQEKLK